MSNTMTAIVLLTDTFSNYAGKEGDKHTLTKAEMRDLLKNEFGDMLGITIDKTAAEAIFKELDQNQDNTVDFMEFMTMVAKFAVIYHGGLPKQ